MLRCRLFSRRSGLLAAFLGGFFLQAAQGAEVLPAAPRNHFNDYAGIVAPGAAQQLEAELTEFERSTSNQVLVAIYPRMQSDSSIEDYTVRVAQSWGVGTKGRKNGAVLFIFSEDRKLFIQVGYGLEGVLPDALCKQIIANDITPRFRQGDYTGGVGEGVHAILAAVQGEYRGTGQTVREQRGGSGQAGLGRLAIIVIFCLLLLRSIFARGRSVVYGAGGRRGMWITPPWGGGGSGGSSGGGGSFSGGGGSFGGGGAGGSW